MTSTRYKTDPPPPVYRLSVRFDNIGRGFQVRRNAEIELMEQDDLISTSKFHEGARYSPENVGEPVWPG